MGLIVRESTAPILDGEQASGAEVESEINKIFTVINGNIDDVNIKAGAAISGSKIASNTIPSSALLDSTLTTAKMAASAVAKGNVTTSTGTETLTTSVTFVDVPGLSSVTLTPGSTNDLLVMELMCTIKSTTASVSIWEFGFSVNGVDTAAVGSVRLTVSGAWRTQTFIWAAAAPVTTSMVMKARYRYVTSAGNAGAFGDVTTTKVFRAICLPKK